MIDRSASNRIAASLRMLLDSGDITPQGARIITTIIIDEREQG